MTDQELEQIYNEGYKAVYWTAMSFLKNEADAEDIVQDVFVTLIKSYETIRDKAKVLPWLKKTAANRCLDKIKLSKTDNMDDEFFDSIEALPEDFLPDSILESDESRKIVMDIIRGSLSTDIQRTLIMFYFNEMSTKEISEALGVPAGTVSWRINFAKKTIKKEVEKYEDQNRTKLFGMGLPFLTKLFMKEAEQVSFRPMPASLSQTLTGPSASKANLTKGSAKKITAAASKAAKEGTGFMLKKIIIGGVSVMLAGTAAVVGIQQAAKNSKAGIDIIASSEVTVTETEDTADTTEETLREIIVLPGQTVTYDPTPSEPPHLKFDGQMAQAVYDALMEYMYNDQFPCVNYEYCCYNPYFYDPDSYVWALYDVDTDGQEELILYIYSELYSGFGFGYVFDYDMESCEWTCIFHNSAENHLYDNGVILSTNDYYPQDRSAVVRECLYVYDPGANVFTMRKNAEQWTYWTFHQFYTDEEIPEEAQSIHGYDYLYKIYDDGIYLDGFYDDDFWRGIYSPYIEGANEVFPEFMPLDEDFIINYVQNMHY
ncbi:MAG: sigma-70 family RNA polymerase sigma factor [Clostridiales bacterium]|nr:sigma-70 family RNA polymerase sigma factor [Clostridiales bacterium]